MGLNIGFKLCPAENITLEACPSLFFKCCCRVSSPSVCVFVVLGGLEVLVADEGAFSSNIPTKKN
jgi:hypothetical protein